MKAFLTITFLLFFTFSFFAQTKSFHDFSAIDIDGQEVSMSQYKGKKILVVNVASECGNTPQYTKLQMLYEQYGPDDFVVIGFPANNFGMQEPGTNEEIKQFCAVNFQVTFPMMSKISVQGEDIHPIYQWLTTQAENGVMDAPVTWNFQKFMINEEGRLIGFVRPKTEPDTPEILDWLRK